MRLAADGQLVVVHDATVDRTPPPSAPFPPSAPPPWPRSTPGPPSRTGRPRPASPRLSEVLDLCAGRARLAIELKTDSPPAPGSGLRHPDRPAAGLKRRGAGGHPTSLRPPVALEIARRLGAGPAPGLHRRLRHAGLPGDGPPPGLPPGGYSPGAQLGRGRCGGRRPPACASSAGRATRRWTWRRLFLWGVDGITSDYPGRALTFLRARSRVSTEDDWDDDRDRH